MTTTTTHSAKEMSTQATSEAGCATLSPRPLFRGPRLERLAYGHTLAHELLNRARAEDRDLWESKKTDGTYSSSWNTAVLTKIELIRRWNRVTDWLYRMEEDTRENMLFLPPKPIADRLVPGAACRCRGMAAEIIKEASRLSENRWFLVRLADGTQSIFREDEITPLPPLR